MQPKRKICCSFIVLILILFGAPVYADKTISTPKSGSYPEPNGKAVILMDASSGRILYERNSHQRMAPASLTKIMTALLVVENGNLNDPVQVSIGASKTPESSIYLQPGEILTRQELLYACLMHSANDAAAALAESVSGNVPSFVQLMNQRAQQLNLQDTHFCNPHGLEAKDHYTSAFDLALLSRQALTNPVFRQVVATRTTQIPWAGHPQNRLLFNQNRLLYRYSGAIGVKTGYTKQAGNCVVGAAQRGNMVLIAVSMDSPTVYEDLESMLDYGFTHYQMITLKESSQIMLPIQVLKGQAATVMAKPARDLAVAATPGEVGQFTFKLVPLTRVLAPVKEGDPLGECQIYLHGTLIAHIGLIANNSVAVEKSLASIWGPPEWMTRAGFWKWSILSIVLLLAFLYDRQGRTRRAESERLAAQKYVLRDIRHKIENKR